MKRAGINDRDLYRLKAMRIGGCELTLLHGLELLPGEIRLAWAFKAPYSVRVVDETTFEITTVKGWPPERQVWERVGGG